MIKKVIFDLDDTLIDWDENNWNVIPGALAKFNFTCTQEVQNLIRDAFNDFSKLDKMFSEENVLNYINENNDFYLSKEMFDTIIDELSNCKQPFIEPEKYEVLEYLSKKYELYVLTNWFFRMQHSRLVLHDMSKYFTKVFGVDGTFPKPNAQAFHQISNPDEAHECVFIGDNQICDYIGSKNFGMTSIWYNPKELKSIDTDIPYIKSFNELKKIL